MHIIPVYTGDNTLAAMVSMSIYILYMVVWASIGLVVISSSLHIDYYSAAFDHECVVGYAARAVCTSVFEFSIGCFAYEDTHYKDCRGLLPLGLCWTAPWLANWHGSWTKRTKTWQNDTKRGCDSMWFYSVNAWYASTFGNTPFPSFPHSCVFGCLRDETSGLFLNPTGSSRRIITAVISDVLTFQSLLKNHERATTELLLRSFMDIYG